MRKKYIFIFITVIAAGGGALVFYFYKTHKNISNISDSTPVSNPINASDNHFIQQIATSPKVAGNIINSGIAGRVWLKSGKPFEASLDIFLNSDMSKPVISVRTHDDGSFQIPLKPGNYILKPADPDGPIAPVKKSYDFIIGDGQWLQTKIEYE